MISILLPSRGRPANVMRLYESLKATTYGQWEMIVHLDDDDPLAFDYAERIEIKYLMAPRMLLSDYWNHCYEASQGGIVQHSGDDIVFRTRGWDWKVEDAMPDDGIGFVHGNDLSPNTHLIGTHGFVTRRWCDTLGYLCPPYFSSDYNDLWLTEVANDLGRRFHLTDVITEHLHPAFDKAEWDQTHQDRVERHKSDNVEQLWESTAPLRWEDARKLRAAIATS